MERRYKTSKMSFIIWYKYSTFLFFFTKILMMAGIDDEPVVFLFVDTQIINESMLEDLNSILNSGDVTNLY